ncbi:family s49 [Nannochloropsis gaditana]|uniref:Family s49 n=1 Tax=Nannochloropsis gaditana TaxID=72520 RepID=W7UAK4_9STRA|nr:family s49 [Nannochloropsis gaditana]
MPSIACTYSMAIFPQDVAASGGYWLLAAGQEVYADKASIVGSVGVVSGGFGLHKLLEHHGIERRLHTAGTSKARLDPFLPARAEDVAYLRDTLAEIHEVFKAHVRARRGAKISGHESTIFSGDFFTGARGVELGLVDAIGSLQSVSKEKLGEKVRINYLNARPRFPFLPGLGTGTGDGSRMSWSAHLADAILESAEERIEERLWRSRVGL